MGEGESPPALELRAFIDAVPALAWSAQPDGSLDFVNRSFRDYTGLSSDQLYGAEWKSAVHRDDTQQMETWWQNLRQSHEAATTELRIRRFDGEYRWFQITCTPVYDEQGKVVRWCGISTDIDDLTRYQQKVRPQGKDLGTITDAIRDRALLDGLFAGVPEAIVLLDTGDHILQINPEFTRVFGFTSEEARGRLINDLLVPEELLAQGEECTRRGLRGESLNIETVRKHKDGTRIHVSMVSGPVSIAGSLISEYVIYRDITERKRAEDALQKSERNFAAIVNTIPTAAWTTRPDGYCDFINQVWLNYVGMTAEQAQGRGWADAIHPDDCKKLIEEWQSCLASGNPVDTEARMRRFEDGSYRWFLIRANPLRDELGHILKWYGTCIDIEDRKRVEESLRARELSWRQIVDNIPGLVATMGAMGEVEFLNRQTLEYFGKTNDELKHWALTEAVHPDDLPRIIEARIKSIEEGCTYEVEHRCRRADGVYRWFQVRGLPVRDTENKISAWYLLLTDIDDRKCAEQKLLQSEADFRTITNNIPGFVHTMNPAGEVEFVNQQILEFFGKTSEELEDWAQADVVHPDDLPRVLETLRKSLEAGQICDVELRCRRADGAYRWFQSRGRPVRNADGQITAWYFLLTDIDDRKRAEQKLRQSEQELRTITDAIPNPIVVLAPDGRTLLVNRVALDLTGFTLDQLDEQGFWARVVHPDDLKRLRAERQERLSGGVPFELEFRALFKSGQYRWQLMQYNPLKDESGKIIRWYSTATDIDDRKRAEQELRKSEENLRTITDSIRQPIVVLGPDGTLQYANRVALDNSGLTMDEVKSTGFLARVCHSDDVDRVVDERCAGLSKGNPFDSEMRMLFKNGQYRWQLIQYDPLKDQSGTVIRWYVTATDIDDRKRTEERLHNENLVLREEIDRSSMFEEIVGSSKPMSQVLRTVEKVAPSDSTVLVLGETGTGKELIARALHQRSKRANRAFVKVNCAAIPQSLIASELFGHEKGAFTGALQRRVGRFEAANGGTLFLDEVGELPMETQIALLRVLQEKEFERVGSNHPISVDVRLVAATNRDLPAAVAAGSFRQDLFYRLNVFPIAVPPLRERADDIPLLVEYFVGRFAKGAGKNIRHIAKQTLEQFKAYRWPGNIRELQNVVERAVILSDTDTFVVDESWLIRESDDSSPHEGRSALLDREVEAIEAALAECHGRISGPSGAAAKLGIPRQTLESKIRRFGIDKYGHKRTASK
jgi:PAS domain S-box-containing protein